MEIRLSQHHRHLFFGKNFGKTVKVSYDIAKHSEIAEYDSQTVRRAYCYVAYQNKKKTTLADPYYCAKYQIYYDGEKWYTRLRMRNANRNQG